MFVKWYRMRLMAWHGINNIYILTHSFPIHPFSIHRKHQKAVILSQSLILMLLFDIIISWSEIGNRNWQQDNKPNRENGQLQIVP